MNVHAKPIALSLDALESRVGQEIGVSEWHQLDQAMVDRFGEVTKDWQFIHVDPVRAKAESPYGGTIAQGFLTLSLLSVMGFEALPRIVGQKIGLNYGFDKVRFLSPVPVGSRVRGRFVLTEVTPRSPTEILLRTRVTVEIAGQSKPALVAEWLNLALLD
ncbi:MAG TPA: MaoC family dehydratase [Xanthobacteraceae bacterium]